MINLIRLEFGSYSYDRCLRVYCEIVPTGLLRNNVALCPVISAVKFILSTHSKNNFGVPT